VAITYGTINLGFFFSPNGSYGCSLWRYISKCWERFFPHFSFEVSDGSTISFWHNQWCGEGPLKELFSGLYALAMNRNAFVPDYRVQGFDNYVWTPVFVWDRFVDNDTLLSFFSNLT